MILQQSFFNYNNNISRFTLSRLGWTTQTRTWDEIWTQDRIFSGRLRVPCHSGIKITKLPNKSDCSCLRRSIADEMESLAVVIPRRMEIEEFENQKQKFPHSNPVRAMSQAMLPSVPDAKNRENYWDLPNIKPFQKPEERKWWTFLSLFRSCLLELFGNTVIEVDSSQGSLWLSKVL